MTTWAVGDVQGCFEPFQRLLGQIGWSPKRDRLWLAGDMVNRGPDSLAMLRWAREHRERVDAVLGNHDIYLLARAVGAVTAKRGTDTLDEVLAAPDADALIRWLRARPLVVRSADRAFAMVHAGLHPTWSLRQAAALSDEVSKVLRGPRAAKLLALTFQQRPTRWDPDAKRSMRLNAALTIMTRVRCFRRRGAIDYTFAGPLDALPKSLTPWWRVKRRKSRGTQVVFGHWAAIGALEEAGVWGIDSGCVWGGALTAIRLRDGKVVQVQRDP